MSAALDVADLAAEQWGLVTSAQARDVGASPQMLARLAHRGVLERMSHGIYRVSGSPPSPRDELRAAWLSLDPARRASSRRRDEVPAVVSHRSAAVLHDLGDLEADEHEFTLPTRKQTRRDDVRLHRLALEAGEWTLVDGLPVTSIPRTIGDLAGARTDGGHLASAVRDAITRRGVDDHALAVALRPYAHHYGAPLGDGEEFLARLLQESGIPEPLERAVSRATQSAGWDARFSELADQVADLQRSTLPPDAIARLVNSPGFKAAMEAAMPAESITQFTRSPGFAAAFATLAKVGGQIDSIAESPAFVDALRVQAAIANTPSMKKLFELAQSPAIREIASKYDEVAKMSRLAAAAAAESSAAAELSAGDAERDDQDEDE